MHTVGANAAALVLLQEEGVTKHGTSICFAAFKTFVGFALVDTDVRICPHLKDGGHGIDSTHIAKGTEVPTPDFSFKDEAEDDGSQRDGQ